jgi:hypothetical protein
MMMVLVIALGALAVSVIGSALMTPKKPFSERRGPWRDG